MKNTYLKASAAFLLAAVVGITSCQEEPEFTMPDPEESTHLSTLIEGQYIVILKEGSINGRINLPEDPEARKAAIKTAVLSMFENSRLSENMIQRVYGNALYGFTARLDDATLARLRKDPKVEHVEQDKIIALAPPSWLGGGEDKPESEMPWGVERVGGVGDGSGKTAWVIDTGIDLDHPDLEVDESRGFNAFANGKDAKSLDDGNGHGTHVAGTIAAKSDGLGVVGIAAGAMVVPIKVLDSQGRGTVSGVIDGVDHVAATAPAGDVANMSLGGGASSSLDLAVKRAADKGIIFTIAAGNDGADANNYSPARVNHENVYTISAMSSKKDSNGSWIDSWASFSNYGNKLGSDDNIVDGTPVDFCAPGVSIRSCWKDGSYNTISGTSMAAPHAAGILLLGSPHIKDKNIKTISGDPDGVPDKIITQ